MNEHWIRVENLAQYFGGKFESYHPKDPRYLEYWADIKRKCIEGMWGEESGGYRFMTGNLYFYGNITKILDTDKKRKKRVKIKPLVQDLEIELGYGILEAQGFSGWMHDEKYTSNELYFDYKENGIPEDADPDLLKPDGSLKDYIPPRENIRKLHDRPMGPPLYSNEAKNFMILGSRGGGKSYFVALAVVLHALVFDGAKYYTEESIRKPATVELCVGSGDTDKSSEFISKIAACMQMFATDEDLGVFGKPGEPGYAPNIFYKDMAGSIAPGNKDNPYIHKYKKKINGRWINGFGSLSKLYHVSYSAQKKGGAEAAAGGRYLFSIIEETGLTSKVIEAYNSNIATVTTDGIQFGVQIFLGTSGNIELIQPSREMFTDPSQYDILAYEDIWEGTGKIGFFLPCYMTIRKYKDKDGNTNIKKAKEHFLRRQELAGMAKNPMKLRMEKMNYPMVPSDMWVSDKGYYLPYEEAVLRERELLNKNKYQSIGVPIRLTWNSNLDSGVQYEIDHNAHPFFDFPIRSDRDSLDGAIQMYEEPQTLYGKIPNDMYIFVHDPYVSDNIDEGGSLAGTYVFMHPKYQAYGFNGGDMVASYIGKSSKGKKGYYENLEKLLAFYGNPVRGLWYEANRGEYCRGWFTRKGKSHLLCLRPSKEKGSAAMQKAIPQYGVIVGSKEGKITMLDDTSDWLLEKSAANKDELNIERFPCIFGIRQMIKFTLERDNFDAISALILYPLALREMSHNDNMERKKRAGKNRLGILAKNKILAHKPKILEQWMD